MHLLVQQLINGLGQGALYALFAIGFGLIFSKLGILNVAHGTFATWGGLITFYAYKDLGIPVWVAIVLATIGAGLTGIVMDIVCFAPLRGRDVGLMGALITSIGAWILSVSLAQVLVGANDNGFPPDAVPSTVFRVAGYIVLPTVVIDVCVTIVVALSVIVWLRWTRFGAAVRAVGFDARSIAITGINTRGVILATAFVAAAIAGLAGALTGLSTNDISFNMGQALLLQGFAAVVIGGVGSVGGAAAGGFLIGITQVLSANYISSSFRDAITFGLLIALLIARPQGIFGEVQVTRA